MGRTLIIWPHASVGGERGGRRLHALYPGATDCDDIDRVHGVLSTRYSMLILVGGRSELQERGTLHSVVVAIRELRIHRVVLAVCHGGRRWKCGTPKGFSVPWSPAQHLANVTGVNVATTTRALRFDDVGQGYGFQPNALDGLDVSSQSDSLLWKVFHKQDAMDELAGSVELRR
ncbi:MAG: hypothetical protein ABWX83_10815 [Luteibacter sp.]